MTVKCIACGKSRQVRNHKAWHELDYCCARCAVSHGLDQFAPYVAKEIRVTCVNCGRAFFAVKPHAKYCSSKCVEEARSARTNARTGKKIPGLVEVECLWCHRRFWRRKCKTPKSGNNFCNNQCRGAYQRRIIRNAFCDLCGVPMTIKPTDKEGKVYRCKRCRAYAGAPIVELTLNGPLEKAIAETEDILRTLDTYGIIENESTQEERR